MDGWMGRWINRWMAGWVGRQINGWMDGGWMDGQMDEWMMEIQIACKNIFIHTQKISGCILRKLNGGLPGVRGLKKWNKQQDPIFDG